MEQDTIWRIDFNKGAYYRRFLGSSGRLSTAYDAGLKHWLHNLDDSLKQQRQSAMNAPEPDYDWILLSGEPDALYNEPEKLKYRYLFQDSTHATLEVNWPDADWNERNGWRYALSKPNARWMIDSINFR